MLSYEALVALERALRDQMVLSVYVDGGYSDPAARDQWRIDLRHSLDDIESWLRGSPRADREAFAACRDMALRELGGFGPADGRRSWVGFFTTNGPQHTGAITVGIPTLAAWSTGPCIAPFIRALKEDRPVIVTVMDSAAARIFRYRDGQVELVDTLERELNPDEPAHMSRPPRPGFHGGTRGRAGAEVMQREVRKGTERLLASLGARLAALEGDPWVVIGGIPSVSAAALRSLPSAVASRARLADRLDVHASEAEVAECARRSASALREADDLARIEEAAAAAAAGGTGAVGAVDTWRALELGQVRELFVTSRYLLGHAADANAAVRRALDQGAAVRHASGSAGERLEALGGVAARLRYPAGRAGAMPADTGESARA